MKHLDTCAALRQFRKNIASHLRVGFVPTMGCLHEGHLTLIRKAQAECDVVMVSLFVNALQFNNTEDYEKYPQQHTQDLALLKNEGVTVAFTPTHEAIYPEDHGQTTVDVLSLGQKLEGESRPGHFQGVATVVSILFNLVQPDYAYFGEKDFQQLALIRQMVRDLHFDIQIRAVPTVRNAQGLALSSRNQRLSEAGRKVAPRFYQILCWLSREIATQTASLEELRAHCHDKLETQGFTLERLDIVDTMTLEPIHSNSTQGVILAAVWFEGVRLIDQVPLSRNV